MSRIMIKDLTESLTLDRKAMHAIKGGARALGRQAPQPAPSVRSNRIIDYPSTIPFTQVSAKSALFK